MPDASRPEDTKALVGKVIEVFQGVEEIPPEEWNSLVSECKDIITERVWRERENRIEGKWEIGDRVLECGEERIRPHLQRLAQELSVSERDLYYCVAFRKKFESLDQVRDLLPEGKNISWHKLINNYIDFQLPKPVIPAEERVDPWGIVAWWKQNGMHITQLNLKAEGDDEFMLVIKPAKQNKEVKEKLKSYSELYDEICGHFISAKKWVSDDIGRDDYDRMYRAIKVLLQKANYDKHKAIKAINWCSRQYRGSSIDWTLDTVIKKYPEAMRPVRPHEKFKRR